MKQWQLHMPVQELRWPGRDSRIGPGDKQKTDGRFQSRPNGSQVLPLVKSKLYVRQWVFRVGQQSSQTTRAAGARLVPPVRTEFNTRLSSVGANGLSVSPVARSGLVLPVKDVNSLCSLKPFFLLKGLKTMKPFSSSMAIVLFL